MESVVNLTAGAKELVAIIELARGTDGFEDASEPSALNIGQPLNSGLTADEVKTALEMVTFIFSSGKALLGFLTALRAYLQSQGGAVGVSNIEGSLLGRVDAGISDSALVRLVPP